MTTKEKADIVVVTSEKLDSILRHNPSWIHEICLEESMDSSLEAELKKSTENTLEIELD